MAKQVKQEGIVLNQIVPQRAVITVVGDSDLILNKMNDVSKRQLTDERKDKAKNVSEEVNEWEKKITAIHWLNGNPTEYSEEAMRDKLENDSPCITAFGLKQSFKQAVTRNKISTYSTEFDATMNVVDKGNGLIPIKFTQHFIDEKLMSPKRGAPVLIYLNRFCGWSAELEISYLENVYSLEQIVNIVNLAGFGLGIGSGRSSGFGRYHVADVK